MDNNNEPGKHCGHKLSVFCRATFAVSHSHATLPHLFNDQCGKEVW